MLDKARNKLVRFRDRVVLHERAWARDPEGHPARQDVILFSYALSLINPQWKNLEMEAAGELKQGGMIAVVDFHDSSYRWIKKYYASSHVKMDGQIYPFLQHHFKATHKEIRRAYGKLWSYFLFIGCAR